MELFLLAIADPQVHDSRCSTAAFASGLVAVRSVRLRVRVRHRFTVVPLLVAILSVTFPRYQGLSRAYHPSGTHVPREYPQ
jgi:hypothetical protein